MAYDGGGDFLAAPGDVYPGHPLSEVQQPPLQQSMSQDLPFRLSNLPRELRDEIYDHALVETTDLKLSKKTDVRSEGYATEDRDFSAVIEVDAAVAAASSTSPLPEFSPLPRPSPHGSIKFRAATNMMLANKFIKQEYEERARKAMVLVLKDHQDYAFQRVELPEHAKSVQSLELHLILFCHICPMAIHADDRTCHAAAELGHHRAWITELLPQMKQLRSLTIHSHICHDKYKSGSKTKLPCEDIVQHKIRELQSLTKLKYLALYRYDFAANQSLDGPKALIRDWKIESSAARDITASNAEPAAPFAMPDRGQSEDPESSMK